MNDPVANKQTLMWTPPPRPEWVQRVNDEGRCMDIKSVIPLDEDSLLKAARQVTGLSDFGEESWHEPFQMLLTSIDEEADLNFVGRFRTRSELLMTLEARLQIEDTFKRHPEIEDEQITEPFVVVGQGRSGTSFLLNMLTANPENGVLRHWEVMLPFPPPERETYATDPRIKKAHVLIDQWNRVTPTMTGIHEFAGHVATECMQMKSLSFVAPHFFGCQFNVPRYVSYTSQPSMEDITYSYHRRVLKYLQWRNPRKHWALKSVCHLYALPTLFKFYPDAKVIWPHRDPVKARASLLNAAATLHWGRSDSLKEGAYDWATNPEISAAGFNMVIDQLEAGQVPAKSICNLMYNDLVTDTMGTIERIYRYFDVPLHADGFRAMDTYLRENPREARPHTKFDIGSAEKIARERRAYQRYQSYFGVPSEV